MKQLLVIVIGACLLFSCSKSGRLDQVLSAGLQERNIGDMKVRLTPTPLISARSIIQFDDPAQMAAMADSLVCFELEFENTNMESQQAQAFAEILDHLQVSTATGEFAIENHLRLRVGEEEIYALHAVPDWQRKDSGKLKYNLLFKVGRSAGENLGDVDFIVEDVLFGSGINHFVFPAS